MYPPAYFLPDDGNLFDIFCREGPEDDEADEVDQGCGHDGGDGGHGVAEEDEQGVVDEPGRAGHSGAGQEEFPDVAPLDAVGNVFTGKVKIERRSDGQIGIGRPGGADFAQPGNGRQVPAEDDFDDGRGGHVVQWDGRMAHALQKAAGDLLEADEEDRNGQDADGRSRCRRRIEEPGNGYGQDGQAQAGRHGDDVGNAHGRVGPVEDDVPIPLGKGRRYGRDEARRQGDGQDSRQLDQAVGHARQIAVKGRRLMGAVTSRFQAQGHDEQVDAGHGRQEHVGRRYGHGQDDEPADDAPRRLDDENAVVIGHGMAAVTVIQESDEYQPCRRPRDGAESGTGSGPFQAFGQENPGQDEHGADPDELVCHLGQRSRRHELQALEIAAETAGDDRQAQGRRQDGQGRKGPAIADDAHFDQAMGAKRQGQAADDGDDGHEGQGHMKDTANAAVMAFGRFLSDHDGHGNGNPGADNAQEQDIDGISHLVQADAFAPQEARQEDTVQPAQDLDDDTGHGEDHGAP